MDGPYPGTIVGSNECANEVGDHGLTPCFLHQEKSFIYVYFEVGDHGEWIGCSLYLLVCFCRLHLCV